MSKLNVLSAAIALCVMMQGAHAQDTDDSERQPQDEATTLDAIQVTGEYFNVTAKSAMKMDVSVMDTPFSVQSYSEAFIQDIEANSLQDMFNYMTGIKMAGLTGMDITFRGFKSGNDDQNSILVDGLPGLPGTFSSPPSIGLERVELVRGSMSVLYGQNQPGGFINLITKKPQYERSTMVGLQGTAYSGAGLSLGDATGYKVNVDTTGHVDEQGTLLYRVIGEYGDSDGFRDHTFSKMTYFAPSLTWNIGGATSLTAQLEYRDTEASFDQGLVVPNRDISLAPPITNYFSEPGDSRQETGYTGSLALLHTFENDWQWNTTLRVVESESEQREFSHVGIRPDGRTLNRRARHLETTRTYETVDTNLTMRFDTGRLSHQLIAGLSLSRGSIDENRLKFFNSQCPGEFCFDIDIYDPVHGQVPPFDSLPAHNPGTPHLLTSRQFRNESLGFYLSDLISLGDRWKASLGVRSLREEDRFWDANDPEQQRFRNVDKEHLLPMAGIVFQPNDNWMIYGSYSESYLPADPADQDENGVFGGFEPLSGEQYEVGVKTEDLFDGRLTASLGVFQITQLNVMNSFPCFYGICYNQLGKARSEGVEIEVNALPTNNWQIIFGYAYNDARVIESNMPVQIGSRLPNAPEHTANIWSKYDFENGFGLGLGVVYVGDYQGVVPTESVPELMPMPGYTVVDMTASYQVRNHSLNLRVGNIFDKTHYIGTGFTPQIQTVPGQPRNVTISYRVQF